MWQGAQKKQHFQYWPSVPHKSILLLYRVTYIQESTTGGVLQQEAHPVRSHTQAHQPRAPKWSSQIGIITVTEGKRSGGLQYRTVVMNSKGPPCHIVVKHRSLQGIGYQPVHLHFTERCLALACFSFSLDAIQGGRLERESKATTGFINIHIRLLFRYITHYLYFRMKMQAQHLYPLFVS